MTDKERFEEIAYNVGVSLDGEKALMSSDDYDFLYNYALEQAERVQELESRIADDEHFVAEILEQNKRYREALSIISANLPLDEREHYVDIARQALGGEE